MYLYKFCPYKEEHFSYNPYLERAFKRHKEWKVSPSFNQAHYTGCPDIIKLLSDPYHEWAFFNKKLYLAKKLKGSKYYPKTFIITNKRIKGIIPPSDSNRWFLKKNVSFGGKDVIVLSDAKEYRTKCKRHESYILQQEIRPKLHKGHKYDLRLYVTFVKVRDQKMILLYENGYVRIAVDKYTGTGTKSSENLTNGTQLTLSSKKDKPKLFCFKELDVYSDTFPKVKEMLLDVFGRIKEDFIKNRKIGFTLIGIDVIIKENGDPVILEINNKASYKGPYAASVDIKKMHDKMFDGFIDAIFVPIIKKKNLTTTGGWHLIKL